MHGRSAALAARGALAARALGARTLAVSTLAGTLVGSTLVASTLVTSAFAAGAPAAKASKAAPAESRSSAGTPTEPRGYHPIVASRGGETVVLTGRDLTADQVVAIARYGAKVALSEEARRRQADAYGLLLEGAAEGMAIYGFNRAPGAGREIPLFSGDPLSPENEALLSAKAAKAFLNGPRQGIGPEVADEEIVRALLAVRANTMVSEAASPALSQMLIDLLNRRVTPVVQSRGSLGEADLAAMGNVLGTMGGAGEAYHQGRRMSAAQALAAAGLKPLRPADAIYPSALTSTNAFSVGQTALLVHDAKLCLDWADLALALDLTALNSSVTPLSTPVQASRPFKYSNRVAARVLSMVKGSYLFDEDPKRIIQDPESQRASYSRQGSAWKAWATLRDTLGIQLNSSDHNPGVEVGAGPADSWELATPQLGKYYVKGGPESHGQHGYILSNANWDPYPMANEIEALSGALANMDVAVVQRIYRFSSTFFTVISPQDVMSAADLADSIQSDVDGYNPTAIWQDIQGLAHLQSVEGNPISNTVEELQAQTVLKTVRARQIVDDTVRLIGEDLLTATFWLDVRHAQGPGRNFGAAPTAAWTALRHTVPFRQKPDERPPRPTGEIVRDFMLDHPAAEFFAPLATYIDAGP
jgi:histidine ammonia-lyase